jgi:hypothetical protein
VQANRWVRPNPHAEFALSIPANGPKFSLSARAISTPSPRTCGIPAGRPVFLFAWQAEICPSAREKLVVSRPDAFASPKRRSAIA